MADQDKQVRGVTAIAVKGFKSLRDETRIEVRPLTVLAGANSSGKSSIMQPLLLLKQTLDAPYDPGALLLNGQNVNFSDPDQIFSVNGATREFSVFLELHGNTSLTAVYASNTDEQIQIVRADYLVGENRKTLRPDMRGQEISAQFPETFEALRLASENVSKVNYEWRVKENRGLLGLSLMGRNEQGDLPNFVVDFSEASFKDLNPSEYINEIQNIVHLSGFRGNPQRSYLRTSVTQSPFSGTFENYTASIISQWSSTRDRRAPLLVQYLVHLQLTDSVEIKRKPTEIEVRVGRTLNPNRKALDTVNIADVGFGVSQVLPVLVALLVAEPGQLVYIEQPELHLHPRAQVALAQVLADAANRGVRVVIETHSDLVLLGIQTLVAEKKLSSTDVVFHWFQRDEEGCTKVTSTDLDEFGRMEMSDFPEDFGTVRFEAQGRFLDAVEITEADTESGD